MKKRDILISTAIIVAALLFLFSYSKGKGRINIDAGGAVATLRLSSNWLGKTTITTGSEPSIVSARLHRTQWLRLSMKQDGDKWQLESRGPWGDLSAIRVKNNDTTVIKLGPPFQIKTKTRFTGTKVSMDFNIIGKADEHYYNVIMKNNKRVSAPKVKIIDKAGTVLATGRFEYG